VKEASPFGCSARGIGDEGEDAGRMFSKEKTQLEKENSMFGRSKRESRRLSGGELPLKRANATGFERDTQAEEKRGDLNGGRPSPLFAKGASEITSTTKGG